jgi:hypothetical protein
MLTVFPLAILPPSLSLFLSLTTGPVPVPVTDH